MSITFAVSDVDRPQQLMQVLDRAKAIPSLLGGGERAAPGQRRMLWGRPRPPVVRVEAFSSSDAPLVSATDAHALAQAAHDAFYLHHPLVLSPDAVWLCLAQGFAHHVALNAEALRGRFVRHQGKEKLVIVRPDFFLGQPNPWPEAFTAFSEQIAAHVGRLRDLIVADFSTTGAVERAASEVVLMDAFQPYFEYEMLCGCGIPAITLLGSADDWKSVRRRAAMLSEFGLEAWTDALLPVLDEVVRTAEGHVDPGFWRSFFRYQSGSGPSELTGWILVLFPYLKTFDRNGERIEPNPYFGRWEQALRAAEKRTDWSFKPEGPSLLQIPSSISSAPVRFVDVRDRTEHPLRFVAGLFGVTQEATTGALAPEFGWAIVHDDGGSSAPATGSPV
ncbi:DUF4419 domain-containing protein [Sorangium sp. So ce145]|uniref:DUF4419 domain-containing protein n=1 Tax=Sorangium sp. So ce145 TaxID=3133285 RepID=UPI003F5F9EA8